MMEQTQWLPGIVVMLAGLVSAALYLLLVRRKEGTPPARQSEGLEDLERRAHRLIDQLKELEAEKHHLAPERYTAEKTRLESEAAAALRARDEHARKAPEPRPAPARAAPAGGFLARNPQLAGAMWGGGVVLFFAVLGYLLMSEQRARTEGQEATGRVPPGSTASAGAGAMASPEEASIRRARERLSTQPDDLEAASELSHELIRRQQLEEAASVTAKGLAVDPFNVELRVHRAVLSVLRGDVEGGRQELQRLVDTYPDAQEALLFLGAMAMQQGNAHEALEHLERFAVEVPREQVPPQLFTTIADLRRRLGVKR